MCYIGHYYCTHSYSTRRLLYCVVECRYILTWYPLILFRAVCSVCSLMKITLSPDLGTQHASLVHMHMHTPHTHTPHIHIPHTCTCTHSTAHTCTHTHTSHTPHTHTLHTPPHTCTHLTHTHYTHTHAHTSHTSHTHYTHTTHTHTHTHTSHNSLSSCTLSIQFTCCHKLRSM